jgi:RNA polymerase sigma-70 factor (ECF subfamily)
MAETVGHTTKLQQCLELARQGNAEAREEIIAHTCERLRKLTRKMLKGYPGVGRWSQTDDVLQNAMLRLHRSLAEVTPGSPREFYGLAAVQIRRELVDLARHYYGAEGIGAKHLTDGGKAVEAQADRHVEPESLEAWTAFHDEVEKLPEEERDVVRLQWYSGLNQHEVAEALGISLATVKRRWQSARLLLFDHLKDLHLD